MTTKHQTRKDKGFTLIEIMIAIVVVGILSAVAVIGITSLTSKGNATACTASADAAKAAATVHYANTGVYPTTLTAMTSATPKELELPSGVVPNGTGRATTGAAWTLTISGGGAQIPPTFTCT
jgi:prepilin-type N-terminal cleavage/methylation domain-containing protein